MGLKSAMLGTSAVVAGAVVGGMVNMGLIVAGSQLLPPPPGVDVNDVASIDAHIAEYSVAQLLAPFVAHAIGVLFLAGGIMAVSMIPSAPLWFDALDLVVAYVLMALLGARLAARLRP